MPPGGLTELGGKDAAMEMDDKLKLLMKQLGMAINQSLAESESVSDAMSQIREAGYDMFLILEATIGFHQRSEEPAASEQFQPLESGDLVLNAQDAKFLKSLRICLTGPEEPPAKPE